MSEMKAIIRQDWRIFRRDPTFAITSVATAVLLMAFVKPAYSSLQGARNGAEQAVPGMTVMISFILVNKIGFVVFREHQWGTWQRLRSSAVTGPALLFSKALLSFCQVLAVVFVMFTFGALVANLDIEGSIVAIALILTVFACTLVALAFALVGMCESIMQFNALGSLVAILFGGLGGALTPPAILPGWMHAIAPASPGYWAMTAMRSVIIDGAGVGDVFGRVLALLGFFALFLSVALARLRVDAPKVSWA